MRTATLASSALGATRDDPHWRTLRDAVDRLRLCQRADGSVDLIGQDRGELGHEVERITGAIRRLAPRFSHQRAYLDAVVADLITWVRDGYGPPDFGAALAAFRPERHREDGIEHLVVFPMYKQNGSRDQVFEALIVRVPWPPWLAQLEAERYDNPTFVPVTFVDHTAGYDSECAVLFPETVAVAAKRTNTFGAIFCDREAARFRRTVAAAAPVLSLNLPRDAQALIASQEVCEQSFALWDLIHDRAHSRGDMPFDPFLIRQRNPYWMYALEELRCDLTAYAEAVELERNGFRFARNVQYAMLLDRMIRFPITGERVRNYDGLAGQLLFAFLRERGDVRVSDGRLTIDWDRVSDGVLALRAQIGELYRAGLKRTKLERWCAARELVCGYVPAASASAWADAEPGFPPDGDPRCHIDLVADDEFPLSAFHASLRDALA
jgi:Family of unknown function (DUF6421)